MESKKTKRLHTLASHLFDGDINVEQMQELSTLLDHDEQAICEYLDYTSLHLSLGHKLRVLRSSNELIEEGTAIGGRSTNNVQVASRTEFPKTNRSIAAVLFSLAVSAVVAAAFLTNSFQSQTVFTAKIIQKIDCNWGDERWGVPQSPLIEAGREIELDRGLMVLEFGNGAEVTLEAPVVFQVLAQDRGNLNLGKLTAVVPKRGRGFTVQTPAGEIVDLGTHFGLHVDKTGTCEAHVFQGKVIARREKGDELSAQKWELAAEEAISLYAGNKPVARMAANRNKFIHHSRFDSVTPAVENVSVAIPGHTNLVLWFDAAKRLQLDTNNRVVSWGNLEIGSSVIENNAWQVEQEQRPAWIQSSLNGKPAIRFDGSSCLVAEPCHLGDEVSIICVLQGLPHKTQTSFGQLFNFNSHPGLILEGTPDNQVAAALIPKAFGADTQQLLLTHSNPPLKSPIVCALTYSRDSNEAILYINGELAEKSTATSLADLATTRYIGNSPHGNRGYTGDVGELLVFNSALSAQRCLQVSNTLMEKYEIAAPQREPRVLSGIVPEAD